MLQLQRGVTASLFGRVYTGIDVSTVPAVDEDEARARIAVLAGVEPPVDVRPELMILPLDSEGRDSAARYRLVWRMRITSRLDIVQYFIDASTGATVLQYSDRQAQSAVGRARGVLGDSKKISVVGERKPFHGAGPASTASHHHATT